MKRFAVALGVVAALLIASPAAATDEKVCPGWQLRTITGADWDAEPAEGSVVQDATTVELAKPAPTSGVEFLAKGLDLSGVVSVEFELSDTASFAAGAIRVFAYSDTNPNTLTDAPAASIAANATSGTLTLPALEEIGAIGLTYDGSNSATGVVTFSNVRVDDTVLSFTDNCATASPSASASPTASPTASASASSSPAASSTTNPALPAAEPALPLTGAGVATLAGIGGALVLAGLALVFRRRRRFEA